MRFICISILFFIVPFQSFAQLPNQLQNYFWHGFSLETARIHNEALVCMFQDLFAEPIEGQKRDPLTLSKLVDEQLVVGCLTQVDFGVLGNLMGGEGMIKILIPQILQGGLYDTLVSQVLNHPLMKGYRESDTAVVRTEIQKILSQSKFLEEAHDRMEGYNLKDSSLVYKNIDPLIRKALADTERTDAERRYDIFQLVWYRESLLIRTYLNLEYSHLKIDKMGR